MGVIRYVVSEGQIIQLPVTTVGQVESDKSLSSLRVCILNHHHYPMKFQTRFMLLF
jgi:hypothetical protein